MVGFHCGDIVKIDLNPVLGHEEGNFRPVLIINSDEYLLPGNIGIILPITTHQGSMERRHPCGVLLDDSLQTKGLVLCFQPRTVDLSIRNASFVEHVPDDILQVCVDKLTQLITPAN